MKSSKLPKGRRARWMMDLQQFQFDIKHRPGKANVDANALSRMYDEEQNDAECYMLAVEPWWQDSDHNVECYLLTTEPWWTDSDTSEIIEQSSSKRKGKEPVRNIEPLEDEAYEPSYHYYDNPIKYDDYNYEGRSYHYNDSESEDEYEWYGPGHPLHIPKYIHFKSTIRELLRLYEANIVVKNVVAG